MLDYKKGLWIAENFCGILLEILHRTQDFVLKNVETKHRNHLMFSLTLSYLLPLFPYLLSFVLDYLKTIGPFFCHGKRLEANEQSLIAETAYRLLDFSPDSFRGLWNWGSLCKPIYLERDETKWYFVKAMCTVLGCSNEEFVEMFKSYFNMEEIVLRAPNSSHTKELEDENRIDGLDCSTTIDIVFTENDLQGNHMMIANMLYPKISKTGSSSQELVKVSSMLRNVKALSVALVSGKAVLLSGDVGSGKTSLVEHFATLTGREKTPFLFKVQLGDQTDSKVRLKIICTEICWGLLLHNRLF